MFPAPWMRVDIRFVLGAASWSCGLWYVPQASISGIDPGDEMQVIANAAHSDIAVHFAQVLSDDTTVDGTKVTIRKDANTILESIADEAAHVGTISGSSGEVLPDEDSVVIQRKTGLIGRNKRGRIFVPWIPESFQNAGTLTDAALNAYRGLAYELAQPKSMGSVNWNPVQPDYKTNQLVTVVEMRVGREIVSRRDRRNPRRNAYYPMAA